MHPETSREVQHDSHMKVIRSGMAASQQQRIVRHLLRHPGMTRNELAMAIGISTASMSARVRPLVDAGYLRQGPARESAVSQRLNTTLTVTDKGRDWCGGKV